MLKLLQSAGRTAFPALFAAVCVLFAAHPLQAEDETYDATVTLNVTVDAAGTATLSPSFTPANDDAVEPVEEVGFQFQDREGTVSYGDSWWNIGVVGTHRLDRSFWLTSGPYYVRARVWKIRNDDGEWSEAISEPSAEVEVVLPPE